MSDNDKRQAGAEIDLLHGGKAEAYGDRGVWVPDGMTAREIVEGARVLEEQFDVTPYTSRDMVRAVLGEIRAFYRT